MAKTSQAVAAETCRRVADEMEGCNMDGSELVAGAEALELLPRIKLVVRNMAATLGSTPGSKSWDETSARMLREADDLIQAIRSVGRRHEEEVA